MTLLSVSFVISSISFEIVQLFPPPVVPTTAQCLPNKEFKATLHSTLLEVNLPKEAYILSSLPL